jgi:hypothetical protein
VDYVRLRWELSVVDWPSLVLLLLLLVVVVVE